MNKTFKGILSVAAVSVLAGSALFAAPAKAPKKSSVMEPPAPVEKELKEKQEIITLVGKVKVSKFGFVKFETKEGTYVLTTESSSSPEFLVPPKEFDIAFEGENHPEGFIKMEDIKKRDGSKLVLSGYLNKESCVFTVLKNGFIKKDNFRDAK